MLLKCSGLESNNSLYKLKYLLHQKLPLHSKGLVRPAAVCAPLTVNNHKQMVLACKKYELH